MHDVECLRPHYAKTLDALERQLRARLDEAVAASSERTARIWRLYLAGCAHAFEQGWVSIYQVARLAGERRSRAARSLPLTRDWMYR